jgi:hypothetical protein
VAGREISLMNMEKPPEHENEDRDFTMTEEERREFIRQAREEIPILRREVAEAIENLDRISKGLPVKRRSEAG